MTSGLESPRSAEGCPADSSNCAGICCDPGWCSGDLGHTRLCWWQLWSPRSAQRCPAGSWLGACEALVVTAQRSQPSLHMCNHVGAKSPFIAEFYSFIDQLSEVRVLEKASEWRVLVAFAVSSSITYGRVSWMLYPNGRDLEDNCHKIMVFAPPKSSNTRPNPIPKMAQWPGKMVHHVFWA